jgi:S-adenosylmethionine:tRNA ribosyltransferase-isomerase
MRRAEFNYELPEELIAQYPLPVRGASRMLHLDAASGAVRDCLFDDLEGLLRPGDMLVFNDTGVIPARLYGHKETGGKVEILVERLTGMGELLAQVRASKPPRIGTGLRLENQTRLEVTGRRGEFYLLRAAAGMAIEDVLAKAGHMPLPPYIKRPDEAMDRNRYQTVYARHPGAVAAPTAGLHFTEDMLRRLSARGCNLGFVTLHVGAGTFQPVRTEHIEDHRMHSEYFELSAELCDRIRRARAEGGRIIAVGTTTVRVLETAASAGELESQRGETDIFIYPGFKFQVTDALLTNFHLPESTLLMLVCAFAGMDRVLAAYRHAVREKYRFFSYGDAMFIDKTVLSDE